MMSAHHRHHQIEQAGIARQRRHGQEMTAGQAGNAIKHSRSRQRNARAHRRPKPLPSPLRNDPYVDLVRCIQPVSITENPLQRPTAGQRTPGSLHPPDSTAGNPGWLPDIRASDNPEFPRSLRIKPANDPRFITPD